MSRSRIEWLRAIQSGYWNKTIFNVLQDWEKDRDKFITLCEKLFKVIDAPFDSTPYINQHGYIGKITYISDLKKEFEKCKS